MQVISTSHTQDNKFQFELLRNKLVGMEGRVEVETITVDFEVQTTYSKEYKDEYCPSRGHWQSVDYVEVFSSVIMDSIDAFDGDYSELTLNNSEEKELIEAIDREVDFINENIAE